MDIIENIATARLNFIKETSRIPATVYLGEVELQKLMIWAKTNNYIDRVDGSIVGADRPEVLGCRVYKVNTEKYLKVS